tara:strand:- start:143 stop:445 length:303 start_codon:yes stop_codon:yes gene_type:complete
MNNQIPFDGATYNHERDNQRLGKQLQDVQAVMKDGNWRTLEEVSALVDAPQASVSARFRDSRKEKFGGWIVERRFVKRGLHTYRFSRPAPQTAIQQQLFG